MKNILKYITLVSFTILSAACGKNEEITKTPINKIKVGEAYALGAATKIQLWADADLNTGYNKLYISALDSASNQQKADATFSIKPMMTMNMTGGMPMTHSSPFEQADASAKKDMLTPAAAIFSMPTSDSGSWKIEVTLNGGKKAIIPIIVKQPTESRLTTTTSVTDNSVYMVALVPSVAYKVGSDDFELQISKKIDGNTYTAANDLTVEITPEMPDMGHGSPNNVNPVFTKNGHYKGKVNFTMTGYWKVNLKIKDGQGALVSEDTFFKITF